MLYETSRLLANQSYQQWVSNELFSFGWFFTMGVLAIIYIVWLKLVDKSRLSQLLLLGSLSSIGFVIGGAALIQLLGLSEYKIRPLPFNPPLFDLAITVAPITFMLVAQYTTSCKSYALWAGIGMAVIAFGILPLYSQIGIYQLHNWNYFYQFLYMLTDGIIARAILIGVISIEKNQPVKSCISQEFGVLQPTATKPLINDKDDTTKDNQ